MIAKLASIRLAQLAVVGVLATFSLTPAYALPDNLTVTASNPWTSQPAVFNLQRYNLRATNYQVRLYSDATNYTLLPTNQIPEPTTYRGRITGDPGAMVSGAFGPDGKFYYTVSYGCRWQANANNYDAYDTTNRLTWGGGNTYVQTAHIPSLGYVTNYAVAPTNIPQHINWSTNNYPAPAAVSHGGPPYLNNLSKVPLQRVRMALDSDLGVLNGICGANINRAIAIQESRINNLDFEQARDLGVCYQIAILCVRTNTQSPFDSTGFGKYSDMTRFWNKTSYGYSQSVYPNGIYDMAHGTVSVGGGGVAGSPGDFSVMDPDWGGFAVGHEVGHNWGQGHYNSMRDYTGDNYWHITQTGSGFGHSTVDVNNAQKLRRTSWKGGIEWVKYNAELPPHATPDFAVTQTNQAVSINVLLNDYIGNSNALSIVSFETNTASGGSVTNLGGGVLRYTPASNFVGYDLVRYYVGEPSGLKSLTAAKILVASDGNPLIGHWTLDETAGNTASETTGFAQAATLYGSASFSSGSVPGIGGGTALYLDGSGYARFKGTWFDPLSTNITLSLWCRPDATPAGEQMLFMKSAQNGGASPGLRLGMNAASFFFSGATHGSTASFSARAAIVPQAGVWYHLVGEIDRTSGLIRLWVNGVEYTGTSNTRTIPAGEFIAGDNWPCLGMANDGGGYRSWFMGAIDDVRFYSQALTSVEIGALYQSGGILPAGGPHPSDGEINVALQPAMSWTPGTTSAIQYRIYLGSTSNAVATATTNSAEFKGTVSLPAYTPSALKSNSTYYWRIDELSGTDVIASPVWAFRTAVDAFHGGLRLQLSLDTRDTVGTTTYDRSGAPFHDATLYNSPAQTNAQVYEGFAFNGTDGYAEAPALNMNSSNVTLLAWINNGGAQVSYAGLLFCRGGATISGLDFRGTTGQLGYHWNDESGSYSFATNLKPPTNEWSLVALVVTPTNATFYLGRTNGTLQTATRTAAHVPQPFDAPLDIARDPSNGRYFNGAMDEVGVWSRALTFAEIGQILTNGINGSAFDGARPVANPATFTWIGDTDVYWNNALNWATNATPVAGSTVYFGDSAVGNTDTQLGQNFSIGGINISGGLRGVGIDGANTLTLGSGGIAASNSVAKISLNTPLTLGAAQTWNLGQNAEATVSGAVGGTGPLTKAGAGPLTVTAANTYSSGTTISDGTLQLGNGANNTASLGTGAVTIGSGATLSLAWSSGIPVLGNNLAGSGTVIRGGTSEIALTGTNTFSGLYQIPNNTLAFRGIASANGQPRVYVGSLGNLALGNDFAGQTCTISELSGAGGVNPQFDGATGIKTLNINQATDTTFSGVMRDATSGSRFLAFTKSGSGTLNLEGANTYTGKTTVSNGTLLVNGSLSTNTVTVAGGTLGGTGTIGGPVTVASGATISPGMSLGTLTVNGALTLNAGSTSTFEVDGSPPDNDAVILGSTVTYGGTLNLVPSGTFTPGQTFTLFSGSGATHPSNFASLTGSPGPGLAFSFTNGLLIVVNTAPPAPVVTLTSPTNSPTYAAYATVPLAATVVTNGNSISSVDFLTNNAVVATVVTPPYTANWTLAAPGGPYILTARANYGSTNAVSANSASVTINPVVTPTVSAATLIAGGSAWFTFNGPEGQPCTVLTTTNVTTPMPGWLTNTSGFFDASGTLNVTNPPPLDDRRFFRVRTP